MEGAVRIVDSEACDIDYRLNLLGVSDLTGLVN